jgi:hypothetical protein
MRILTALLLASFALASVQARADTTTWEPMRGFTSAELAAFVTETNIESPTENWRLLSSSTMHLPDAQYAVITFWQLYHHSHLDWDGIYRCVDVFNVQMEQIRASCETPMTRQGE